MSQCASAQPRKKKRSRNLVDLNSQTPDAKLTGWEWFRSIGSPRFILSPMVGQSELAYRLLARKHGAQLTYTPMLIADRFASDASYRKTVFQYEPSDRPLIVQFCATTPDDFINAAKHVVGKCDAVELNLGCPQDVAKRGGYGSWMMERVPVICDILTKACTVLPMPVTAKIRVFPRLEQTLEYCMRLESCGISMLTIHPRLRHHREEVLSDWPAVCQIRSKLSIPVVLNGDMWSSRDVAVAMSICPVDGYMCAQGALHNPAIFEPLLPFAEYNRPTTNEAPLPTQGEQGSDHQSLPKNKKTKSGKADVGMLPSLASSKVNLEAGPDPDPNLSMRTTTLTSHSFPSTTVAPYDKENATAADHFRQRPVLPTSFLKDLHPPLPSPTNTTSLSQQLDLLSDEQLSRVKEQVAKIPVHISESHLPFLYMIAAVHSTTDHCKRQLRLAVEYLDIITRFPVPHHSISSRHLFFILFDLLHKYTDMYDLLHAAVTVDDYKQIIHTLMKRAVVGIDPSSIKNVHQSGNGIRNYRRDGTLAPPPWPPGGGGLNISTGQTKKKALPRQTHVIKAIDMSKFD